VEIARASVDADEEIRGITLVDTALVEQEDLDALGVRLVQRAGEIAGLLERLADEGATIQTNAGDSPVAVAVAEGLRRALEQAGVKVVESADLQFVAEITESDDAVGVRASLQDAQSGEALLSDEASVRRTLP
jgi:hypothetical protein